MATATVAHLHGDDLRENRLGDSQQDGQQPDGHNLQTGPEDGAGGLNVHRVDNGLVPDVGGKSRRRTAAGETIRPTQRLMKLSYVCPESSKLNRAED